MKSRFRESVARKLGNQTHFRAWKALCAQQLCVPMLATVRHVLCKRQKNGLAAVVPLWLCAVSTALLLPPSQSAMMDFALLPIMPDCHGGLSRFAVEKSVPPRGDQISVT